MRGSWRLVLSLAVFAACKTSQVSSHEGAAVTPAPSAKSVPSAKPATSSPAVTADTAARLAKHFGGDAASWLAMQASYDLKTLPTLGDIERKVAVREQLAA